MTANQGISHSRRLGKPYEALMRGDLAKIRIIPELEHFMEAFLAKLYHSGGAKHGFRRICRGGTCRFTSRDSDLPLDSPDPGPFSAQLLFQMGEKTPGDRSGGRLADQFHAHVFVKRSGIGIGVGREALRAGADGAPLEVVP